MTESNGAYLPAGCALPLSILTFIPHLRGRNSLKNISPVTLSVHIYAFCLDHFKISKRNSSYLVDSVGLDISYM